MTVMISPHAAFYRARLGAAAAARGERIVCQLLGWTGADASLAQVRIVSSTVPGLSRGRVGLVPQARLVPLRQRTPTPGRATPGREEDAADA